LKSPAVFLRVISAFNHMWNIDLRPIQIIGRASWHVPCINPMYQPRRPQGPRKRGWTEEVSEPELRNRSGRAFEQSSIDPDRPRHLILCQSASLPANGDRFK
jgi:hypothetical protein